MTNISIIEHIDESDINKLFKTWVDCNKDLHTTRWLLEWR